MSTNNEKENAYLTLMDQLESIEPGLSTFNSQNRYEMLVEQQGSLAISKLKDTLKSKDPEARADAAEMLGRFKRKAGSALLPLKNLIQKDPDREVRQTAAIATLRIGGDSLLAEVVKNLRHDDPQVVAHAAVTLGKVGESKVVPNLLRAFQTEDPLIGSAVAWALGRLKDPRAISWLGAAIDNGFIPANAAEALGRIGHPDVISILLRTLENSNDDARAYAARALGLIKEPENLKGIRTQSWLQQKEGIIQSLQNCLEEEISKKVKIFACISLFELGDKSSSKTFRELLQQS